MIFEMPSVLRIDARPVLIPFRRSVQTASFVIPEVPLVLIDLHTDDGIVGRAYVLAFAQWVFKPLIACIEAASEMISGQVLAPINIAALLRERMLLVGNTGITGIAIGGIDMALWDAVARTHNLPLVSLLGGKARQLPTYNSCGLWLKSIESLADEASALLEEGGFNAIKIRLGRSSALDDLTAVRVVRERIGIDCALMADFNQSLRTGEAIERGRMLDKEGLTWIEDPIAHDNYEGHAKIRSSLTTPIQTGENFYEARKLKRAIEMGALDFVMPDAALIGGVTGWMQAAAIADAYDIPMSSHLYPEFSRHLLAVTPSAHWLEYVDWAAPILQDPVRVMDGRVIAPNTPGAGLEWDEGSISRFLA
tara:strand:+ start:6312 stop:7406 length:1095 start_codon:yes stop_codon:yes gene_type:complete